jgi:hypothetical protein
MAMENETAIKLIKLYEGHRVLWDPLNKKHYDKNVKQDAWNDISFNMGIPVDVIKKKMTSLTGSYRREKSRHNSSLTTGSGIFFVHSLSTFFRLYYQASEIRMLSYLQLANSRKKRSKYGVGFLKILSILII